MDMQTAAYLILPLLDVEGFNAESNQYVAGIPAMTAFTGYGHLLERKIQALGWKDEIQVEGVAVMVHEMNFHAGHPKCPDALPGTKSSDILAPRIIEEMKGDMSVTLILRLVVDIDSDDLDDDALTNFLLNPEFKKFLYDFVYANPCCGGACHKVSTIKVTPYVEEGDEALLSKELQRIHQRSKGHFIYSRSDLIEQAQAQGADSLDAVLNAMRLRKTTNTNKQSYYKRDQEGWIIPLAIGYQALETPQARLGARKQALHVYAEPLTSLGELIYGGVLWRNTFEIGNYLWVHQADAQKRTYTVKTLSGANDHG